jgi:hypothetical protein
MFLKPNLVACRDVVAPAKIASFSRQLKQLLLVDTSIDMSGVETAVTPRTWVYSLFLWCHMGSGRNGHGQDYE